MVIQAIDNMNIYTSSWKNPVIGGITSPDSITQYSQGYAKDSVSFKGNGTSPSQISETVGYSAESNIKNKKGMSALTKCGITLGTIALLGLGARFGYKKHLKNIFDNKLKLTDLPEKIIFNKASTKEEALKYTRETLKINDINENLSLDLLNYINKAITDVSNFHKGKFLNVAGITAMDKEIAKAGKGCTLAGIDYMPLSKDFTKLEINTEFFNHEHLNKVLKEMYYTNGKIIFNEGKIYKFDNVYAKLDSNYEALLQKYYKEPAKLSFEEKLRLLESYDYLMNNIHNLQKGIKTGAKGIKSDIAIKGELISENNTIFHEFGHLQDLFKYGKEERIKHPFICDINFARNNTNILPTKKHKEFLNTQSIQETAGKVSDYAKTSREEFIAETYARLLEGETLPEDVMALYKKYNGPMLN